MGDVADVAAKAEEAGVGETNDLQSQVRSLQKQIDSMDASTLTEAVQKLNSDIQRITSRMRASLASAEAAVAGLRSEEISSNDTGAAAVAAGSPGQAGKMSADVSDSNTYSRLMALQRLGVVQEYARIQSHTVAVVGIGGIGSVATEMLTRCGVGCLLIYDYDCVKPCNLNRLFYKPDHVGMAKTEAVAIALAEINPDVRIETYNMNITTVAGYKQFGASLTDPSSGKSRVDLLLSCVDNYEARLHINQTCLDLQQAWMESGVSEDALSGHIQLMSPGKTACFECAPPLAVASGLDESSLNREVVCSASLPTTMGIISGLLVQNALKFLLNFGEVSHCLGYMSLRDFFPRQRVLPNPECRQASCKQLQQQFRDAQVEQNLSDQSRCTGAGVSTAMYHDDNAWDICVVERVHKGDDSVQTVTPDQACGTVVNSTLSDLMADLEDAQRS
eukprot:jgi/Ulvmu1/10599/UM065_0054.1